MWLLAHLFCTSAAVLRRLQDGKVGRLVSSLGGSPVGTRRLESWSSPRLSRGHKRAMVFPCRSTLRRLFLAFSSNNGADTHVG